MLAIKPISSLRNKTTDISEIARLSSKLAAAQSQIASGDRGRTLKQVMKDIRKRLHESS